MKPFEEIVRFIAEAAGPEKLRAFKPSPAAERRVAGLLAKQQAGTLRPQENEELQLFVQLGLRHESGESPRARAGARLRGMSEAISARLRRLVVERALGVCESASFITPTPPSPFRSITSSAASSADSPRPPTSPWPACAATLPRGPIRVPSLAVRYVWRPLYHPRHHRWTDHFRLAGARIVPLTDESEATVQLLSLNADDRLLLRRALIKGGRYPSLQALAYLWD